MNSLNAHRMELGRRLIAALLSFHYGLTLDYALQTFVPQEVHASWDALGQALLHRSPPRSARRSARNCGTKPVSKGSCRALPKHMKTGRQK